MTDEEISEFAEALQSACDEHIANGGTIGRFSKAYNKNCKCPLGALIGNDNHPSALEACESLEDITGRDFSFSYIREFIQGFECDESVGYLHPNYDYRLFNLGRLFQKQYC